MGWVIILNYYSYEELSYVHTLPKTLRPGSESREAIKKNLWHRQGSNGVCRHLEDMGSEGEPGL